MLGFSYFSTGEAIETCANAHWQSHLSGKDITSKTTQPFLKISYELI